VVIDEAYHEFSGETVVPLLARHPNLVVLRTFSKAMALAGLRVGYLLASPDLVLEINKARLPYNLNFFSQAAALAALQQKHALERSVARLVRERERLLAALASMPGVRAWPSRANFFILEILDGIDPREVFASLLRRGVLVRDVTSYAMLGRCLRVSVGREDENEVFLHALGTALGEAGVVSEAGRA
jgi:histidinol-phosphate aminotransferase